MPETLDRELIELRRLNALLCPKCGMLSWNVPLDDYCKCEDLKDRRRSNAINRLSMPDSRQLDTLTIADGQKLALHDELVTALIQMTEAATYSEDEGPIVNHGWQSKKLMEQIDAARALIAKAKGRKFG